MKLLRSAAKCVGAAVAVGGLAYAAIGGMAWWRYGHVRYRSSSLDRFFPESEIVEHHEIRVDAPAEAAFIAACQLDLRRSAIVRAIFRTRELFLCARHEEQAEPLGLVRQAKVWGWGVLAEEPGREIVFGAVTQPWVPNPVFRALPPVEFLAFRVPGYVKIAWTLRAEPIDEKTSIVITETRAVTTSPEARARFRRYWALTMPGIVTIRRLALGLVKDAAEQDYTGSRLRDSVFAAQQQNHR